MNKYIFIADDTDGYYINTYIIESSTECEAVKIFLKNTMPLVDPCGINTFEELVEFLDKINIRLTIINFNEIKTLK